MQNEEGRGRKRNSENKSEKTSIRGKGKGRDGIVRGEWPSCKGLVWRKLENSNGSCGGSGNKMGGGDEMRQWV